MVDIRKFTFMVKLYLVFGSTDLIDGPSNTVATVGQRMEIKCQTGSNSIIREWSLQRPQGTKETIFVNLKDRKKIHNPRFEIVDAASAMNGLLYTNSTEMDDAGIYSCAVQIGLKQPERYSAHLIVVDTKPLCNTSLSTTESNIIEEGTYVWIYCTVNFRGSWTPTLEWILTENIGETYTEERDITDLANVIIHSNENVSSLLKIAMNATSNSSYFSCRIYFSPAGESLLVTAENTPNYSYIVWESPMITVIVPPSIEWRMVTTESSSRIENGMDPRTISVVVLSILFVVAISSVVATIIYSRRKKRPAVLPTETLDDANSDEYYTVACDDYTYDTIAEVGISDDFMIPECPPRKEVVSKSSNFYEFTPAKSDVKSDVKSNFIDDTYLQPMDTQEEFTDEKL